MYGVDPYLLSQLKKSAEGYSRKMGELEQAAITNSLSMKIIELSVSEVKLQIARSVIRLQTIVTKVIAKIDEVAPEDVSLLRGHITSLIDVEEGVGANQEFAPVLSELLRLLDHSTLKHRPEIYEVS